MIKENIKMTEQEKRKELFDLLHGIIQKYRNDEHVIAVKIAGIAGSLLVLVDAGDDDSISEVLEFTMGKSKSVLMMVEFIMQLKKVLTEKYE